MESSIPRLLRSIVNRHPEEIAMLSRDAGGPFRAYTYRQLQEMVQACAAGLLSLGIRRGDHIGLISENRKEWLISDLAIQSIGAVDIPRGADSTAEEIRFILDHADCAVSLVEDAVQLQKILSARRGLPLLKTLIILDPGDELQAAPAGAVEGMRLLGFPQLLRLGRERLAEDPDLVEREVAKGRPEDLATILYTSGTTGEPKGVMLTHRNFLSQIENIPRLIDAAPGDIWLSVLPVWHSFARIMQYVAVGTASALAYSRPIGKVMLEDMAEVRPTWMASVPRIWESVRAGIYRAVNARGVLLRTLFPFFVAVGGLYAWFTGMFHGLLPQFHRRHRWIDVLLSVLPMLLLAPLRALGDLLVFRRIRHLLGGRFKAGISGSAALPPRVDKFFSSIGVLVLEGYGLTETAPVVSVRVQKAPVPLTVGPPLKDTEVRILDEAGRPLPPGKKGAIFIRGPQVMKGYYKRPEETRRVIDEEGWLNSGDLGLLTWRGEIAIRGRVKDTIVLLGGENVEPEPIEQALSQSEYIDQAMVVGQDRKFLGALIVPDMENLEKYADENSVSYLGRESLLETPEVQQLIREEIDRTVNLSRKFKGFERIFRFYLLAEPFRLGEEITHTMKIKRNRIADKYSKEIEKLFR